MKKKFIVVLILSLIMFMPYKVMAADNSWKISENIIINNFYVLEDAATTRYTTQGAKNKPADVVTGQCDTELKDLIKHYWKWIMFATPILLIVMITFDFIKAMSSGDADAIKKSSSNAIKRVIAGIILLALPWALEVIFGWFGLQICF